MNSFALSLATQVKADTRAAPVVRAMQMLRRDMERTLSEHGEQNEIRLRRNPQLGEEAWKISVTERKIVIHYGGELGAVYALLRISNKALSVLPFWFWMDQPMERQPIVYVKSGDVESEPAAVCYRGWFINDEVLLHTFVLDGSKDKPWEMAFEALLRLGGNMVIPGTDKNAHRYRDLAASFGLYITHHHAEPLGAQMFRRAYPGLKASYAEHPELFRGLWRDAIRAQRGKRVVWNVGFRGQGDSPFWAEDPRYDTPQRRGALISQLIREQVDMVRETYPGAPCCTNLYGEVMELYRDGHIDLPDDVIRIWADNGFGKMVSRRQGNHNPRVPALPEPGSTAMHGLYYHASFYDLQAANHMTMLHNPPGFVRRELKEALDRGVRDYWIVNCSNIKPHVYTLDFIAAFWQNGDCDPKAHREEFCRAYYGEENAPLVARSMLSYYMYAVNYGPNEDDHAGEQFPNHGARMLVSQWMKDANAPCEGMFFATGEMPLAQQIDWFAERCDSAAAGYEALVEECEGLRLAMSGEGRTLFEDSIMMQARLLERTYTGAMLAARSLKHAVAGDWLAAFFAAGQSKEAFLQADAAMRSREHGHWRNFYANDCLADVKQSAWLMGVLMGTLRNLGDGPHFYGWQRRFLDAPEDTGIMLILNMENHMDDDALFSLMKARMA